MGNPLCKWVCDRLPLLAGDDLQGLDRRRVERHLIGCPHCRAHQTSLGQALEVLRAVATTSLAPHDARSLWPALQRQIRESRRPVPAPGFALPFALAWPRVPFRLAFGLGLGLLAAIGVNLTARHEVSVAQTNIAANEHPIVTIVQDPRPRSVETPEPTPRYDAPKLIEGSVVETPTPPRIDYDLEYFRPMPPDAREPRDTKATY